MDDKKQIEEMANIINNFDPRYECQGVRCKDCEFFSIKYCYMVKALYNAGYRKQRKEDEGK